jgi:hypothetical protein
LFCSHPRFTFAHRAFCAAAIFLRLADETVRFEPLLPSAANAASIRLSNTEGDVLLTKEGGSIAKNVKTACGLITADWSKKAPTPTPSTPTTARTAN